METEVIIDKEFDGTNWYVTFAGHKAGPGMTKVECDDIINWFHAGGLQGMFDVMEIVLDKAFKEREK